MTNNHHKSGSSRKSSEVDFTESCAIVNQLALEHLPEVLEGLLGLDIKIAGKEVNFLNPLRVDYEFGSCSINSETGRWADFATNGFKGGDVVGLVAKAKTCSQGEALKMLREFLGTLKAPTTTDAQTTGKGTGLSMAAPALSLGAGLHAEVAPSQDTYDEPMSAASAGEVVPEEHPALKNFGPPTAEYSYVDAHGLPVAKVCRYDKDGAKSYRPYKLVRQAGSNKLIWQPGTPDHRPLYNLDKLAAKPEAIVIFCEGGKAANAAATLFPAGVATTSMNGAQSTAKSDFGPLAGRGVIVAPDNDEAGEAYKDAVISSAMAAGATILGVVRYPKEIFGKLVDGERQDVAKGYDLADALAEGWTGARFGEVLADVLEKFQAEELPPCTALQVIPTGPGTSFEALPERASSPIPDDFTVTATEVIWNRPNKDGGTRPTWLAGRIEVLALTRSVESQSWGRLVRFRDPDGIAHEWCIPQTMFGAEQGSIWSGLLALGCHVVTEPALRQQLARYIQGCEPQRRGLSVRQPGWTGSAFVFPDGTSYGSGNQLITFETRDPLNQMMFVSHGTLAQWNEHVAPLCVGNSRLGLAVCIALSGPTLHLLSEENSGYHFRGPSSVGKTTVLRVACSVVGQPSKVMRPWRATANGLEGTASQHNDLVLALDEFGEISPVEASATTYMLGNGQGKSRATVTGAPRLVARWRLAYISTGEISLENHLQSAGITVRAGQEARFVDIEAVPAGGHGLFEELHGFAGGAELARALTDAANSYYGTPVRAFVEQLANPDRRTAAIQCLRASIDSFVERCVPVGADGQVQRVARRFAVAAAAGELAVNLGLLAWGPGQATWAARTCFDSWIERRGGTAGLERNQACEIVRRHLEVFGERNFRPLRVQGIGASDWPTQSTEVHGYKRELEDGRTQYMVLPSAFKTIVCRGQDSQAVARHLKDAGMLVCDQAGNPTKDVRVDGTKKRLHVINPDLLGEAGSQELALVTTEQPSVSPQATMYRL